MLRSQSDAGPIRDSVHTAQTRQDQSAEAATLADVRAGIEGWYTAEHRDFPWRGLAYPYAILVSEVMLQQTQASRIAARFPRFMARFPSVEALAAAPASDLGEERGLMDKASDVDHNDSGAFLKKKEEQEKEEAPLVDWASASAAVKKPETPKFGSQAWPPRPPQDPKKP